MAPTARQQQQPSRALEVQQKAAVAAKALMEQYRPQFANVVPDHISADAFIELALAMIKRDKDLIRAVDANPASLVTALRRCAALGHVPMPGVFSLVAFPNKKALGGIEVIGMEEWRGLVQRMLRSGGVDAVVSEVVREKDHFAWNPTRMLLPQHEYDPLADPRAMRGHLVAVYAFARLKGGGVSSVAVLNRHEVARHRAMAKSIRAEGGGNFWGPEWPGEGPNTVPMWRKTAVHVLEGSVPTSANYVQQRVRSEQAATGWAGVPDQAGVTASYTGEAVDAELVDEPAPHEQDPNDKWPTVAQPGQGAADA